ncbi:MAG TPA: purine-nucleoside phosphorylase [Verrucomicrobia bacterium]|nr:MAG: purine-nucleoside phosphorylase [Lentisphaerae bacterium GWF2_57_35]HBA82602.1 purine-nucleoside phosphorylase [Verrucomicrobiota bacterium]
MNYDILDQAVEFVRKAFPHAHPVCGLVLGSGWSDVAEAFEIKGILPYEKIAGLGATGVVGHAGRLVWGVSSGLETFVFQGRRHWYEGEGWTPIALPIFVLKQFGATSVVLTNAAGGIRKDLTPGDLMAIDDHINLMCANPLMGKHNTVWGPRFPDQSHVYNSDLRDMMDQASKACGVPVTHGVYLAGSGPSYETPAEIRAWQTLGADAVGMSTVPEALLASAASLRVGGISCITNYAAGISPAALSHEEVTDTTRKSMGNMKKFLIQLWKEMAHE